jgi:aminopeptidase N
MYAQPSQIRTADYAANTTKIIFDYFEEYFNMTYSIGKLGNLKQLYYHPSYWHKYALLPHV